MSKALGLFSLPRKFAVQRYTYLLSKHIAKIIVIKGLILSNNVKYQFKRYVEFLVCFFHEKALFVKANVVAASEH